MTEERAHYELTKTESNELPGRILAILIENKTNGKRVTGKQLARLLGYRDDRKVRVAIGQLILKGYLILSSVRKPYGYFLAESKAEIDTYLITEFSRIKEQHARIKAIQASAAKTIKDIVQLRLTLE